MNTKGLSALSIRAQFSIIFTILMAATIFTYWCLNILLFQPYYINSRHRQLTRDYQDIDNLFRNHSVDSDEFVKGFLQICSERNMSVVILDSSLTPVASSVGNNDFIIDRLMDHLFDSGGPLLPVFPETDSPSANQGGSRSGSPTLKGPPEPRLLSRSDNYEIMISWDPRLKSDYMELWGTLSNGYIIFMRTALKSIRDSVSISNHFLGAIAVIILPVCALIIWFVSSRATSPIYDLAEISERMCRLDFNAKYEGGGAREIEALGVHMNELSSTLEKTISELKTANNELRRDIEKKEKINSMRLEFLSNVAHELKTPIALIQGYAEGLRDNMEDSSAEDRTFYCDVIIDESHKMNSMVKNLMTLNQLEFGHDNISLERFDIVELIRGCISSADILLKSSDIRVSFNETEPVFVWSDEYKVEEVFTNYFSNAIHYCAAPANDPGSDRQIDVKLLQGEETVRISVFNTGNSIPEESLEHLWEKFYKVDKARTHEYGGSGIGLSIVKAIMDALHRDYGVINYDNGVEFWFELDCSESRMDYRIHPRADDQHNPRSFDGNCDEAGGKSEGGGLD